MKHFMYFSLTVLLGLSIICFNSCQETKTNLKVSDTTGHSLNIYGGISNQDIKDKLANSGIGIVPDSIKIKRCPCDTNLIKVTLPNDCFFIKGHDGEVVVKNNSPGGQEGRPGFNSSLITEIDKQINNTILSQYEAKNSDQNLPVNKDGDIGIKVAVFDSGLDPDVALLNSKNYESSPELNGCGSRISPSKSGWDFNTYRPDAVDDLSIKHGSRVAQLISRQFNDSKYFANIVSYKVLDKDNNGSLFDLLCAMENARQNKIPLFNMSLGYYGARDSIFTILTERVTHAGIIIVAAAGNQMLTPPDSPDYDLARTARKFYPAFYAQSNPKVFAITTINSDCKPAIGQNYNKDFVIGVKGNNEAYLGLSLRSGKSLNIYGSSYAAPIFTGWLARTYPTSLTTVTSGALSLTACGSSVKFYLETIR